MLTLDLPPSVESQIIQSAHAQDLSVSQYIQSLLPQTDKSISHRQTSLQQAAGLMAGKLDDMLAHQQQMRDSWD